MARLAALVGVGVLALAPGTAVEAPLRLDAPEKPSSRLLGIAWSDEGHGRSSLVAVDPRSLEPLPGRSLGLFGGAGSWAYSPDRSRLALAGSCQLGRGLSAGIVLVDVARLRATRCLWLGGVTALLWPEPRRLIALAGEVISIDPTRARVLDRSPLPLGHQLIEVARAGDRLVLLVAEAGYARLMVVDGHGIVRSTPLDLPAGIQPREATFVRPGLAVDPLGARAFVVPDAGPVAETSLDTLAVEYRSLRENVSLLGRLAAWLQPTAEAKEIHPRASRTAVWLGDGRLAVVGTRSSGGVSEPTGLVLIDTLTWSRTVLDEHVSSMTLAGGRLVATGPRAGIRVFDLRGRLLYRRFDGRDVWLHLAYRGRIAATVGSERSVRMLEVATGKTLERHSDPPPRLLLEASG